MIKEIQERLGISAVNPNDVDIRNVINPLSDDLNTPAAMASLSIDVGRANAALVNGDDKLFLVAANEVLVGGQLLGLLSQDPEAWFKWCPAAAASPDDTAIEALIVERREARKAKNFARADQIRDELKAQGILLEDGAGGTTWRRG
jgi:cysteinyl-tRNA synthetase